MLFILQIAMTTLCSVFLNVALQDAEAVQNHSTVFKELLCLLAAALAQIGNISEPFEIRFRKARQSCVPYQID